MEPYRALELTVYSILRILPYLLLMLNNISCFVVTAAAC